MQSTTVATSLRQPSERRLHRFSWINEWTEHADAHGRAARHRADRARLVLRGVLDDALVLTIDRAYFALTGGLERWLYRLVRKHGGQQEYGWRFDFRHLHAKSASLSPFKHFAFELRDIVRRQPLPGYSLGVDRARPAVANCSPFVSAAALSTGALWTSCGIRSCYQEPRRHVPSGTAILVLSGTETAIFIKWSIASDARNLSLT